MSLALDIRNNRRRRKDSGSKDV